MQAAASIVVIAHSPHLLFRRAVARVAEMEINPQANERTRGKNAVRERQNKRRRRVTIFQ